VSGVSQITNSEIRRPVLRRLVQVSNLHFHKNYFRPKFQKKHFQTSCSMVQCSSAVQICCTSELEQLNRGFLRGACAGGGNDGRRAGSPQSRVHAAWRCGSRARLLAAGVLRGAAAAGLLGLLPGGKGLRVAELAATWNQRKRKRRGRTPP
jgi:hypothetical protein